jgi:iron-sulfur cluster assembly protein
MAMLAITEVAAIAIEEMLASRRMPREAGVRLTTGGGPAADGERGQALVLDLAPAPLIGDAVLGEAPVFIEAEAAPALDEKLLDADVSSERVRFTLHDRDGLTDGIVGQ